MKSGCGQNRAKTYAVVIALPVLLFPGGLNLIGSTESKPSCETSGVACANRRWVTDCNCFLLEADGEDCVEPVVLVKGGLG